MAKADWKRDKRAILKASVLLFAFALVLSLLISYLFGINRLTTNFNNIVNELNSKPELLANPTDEFINETAEKMMTAIPKVSSTAILLGFVLILFRSFLYVGFEGYCLGICRKEELKAKDIMCSFEHFGKVLVMLIIRTAATVIGSMFFVIPGLIIHYAFSQCFMVMYDHPEYSAFRCLRESARLMRGHKMMFFVLQLSFIFWHFLENFVMRLVMVNILMIYTKPFICLSQAHFYNLLAHPEMYNQQEAQR